MHPQFVAGQLLTPLTRYKNAGMPFAIDNGAFSGFRRKAFDALLEREHANKSNCLFVTVPDVVAAGRRTLEIWRFRHDIVRGWPLAFVAQNGVEDLEIPWREMEAIFIGGGDPWKDSKSAIDIVKTAKAIGKHVHVGRVNTWKRFELFACAGADTCDGSGVAMYDHMLDDIAAMYTKQDEPLLFNLEECE